MHPDVGIQVISRQFSDHHTAMTTALSTSVYLPDVMALEVGYVGRFAQGGGLDDLSRPPYGVGAAARDWVPYALAQATSRSGAVVAAPTDIGPGTLLLRTDILARAGVAEAELTQSWDAYVEAGVRIKRATGAHLIAHARDLKDILIRTGVKPGEGLYFDARSRVLVTSPRFVRAFELARAVRRLGLDAKVVAWSNDWSEGFRRGTLATQMSGAWLTGHLAHWLAPATAGLWRAAQLPGGAYAAYGGTFYAIARRVAPARKVLAWDFIRLMTLDRAVQLASFKSQDAFPALMTTYDDGFFDQPIPFLGGQPARRLWRDAARRITAVAVHKQDAFASEVIDTELDKVLDRGKDIGRALADADRLLAQRALR
ncbi:MAG: extracellular solute-binding protein [Burkholderiales bacterium]|nr:extracellular solute-binding protein [Burkholderiales bacterium]MDE1926544.1 extracellular solute-binding protein [Burkholderiales bacterium]MDE2505488.1 extracellular solute-binding protein [Burkholderiales bacterium]